MDCTEAQALIEDFLHDRLNGEQRTGFVKHINSCSKCRDELDIYNVIYSVVSQLENDSDEDIDYRGELERKLRLSENAMKRKAAARRFIEMICFLALLLLICLLFM